MTQKTPQTPKNMTNNSTDTPRTDSEPSNQPMLSAQSDPVELYHKLIAVTVDYGKALGACAEYREQLDESKADLMRTQIEMQLEIDRAEAEVERLKKLLQEARPVLRHTAMYCFDAVNCICGTEYLEERIDEALNATNK